MKNALTKLGSREPFIIAEMSGNHNGSLDRALKLVEAAAASGADAIKLQTYTAETMTLDLQDGDFLISDPKSLWSGRTLYSLYEEAHTPWDWHEPIFRKARELGIVPLSTPFDASAVSLLEELEVEAYKIASFENIDLALIREVASKGKPVIISTGLASVSEIAEAVNTARENGCENLTLLKTTSSYPASPENSNLLTIPHMKTLFRCSVGISDHTLGIGAALAAVALGASVIEKHLTLDRSDGGVDSSFSMTPDELSLLVRESKNASLSLGEISYGPSKEEMGSFVFRRSLYITSDMKKGEELSQTNLRAIRPGFGLAPKYLETVIGKKVNQDIVAGTRLSWDLIG